MDFKKLGELVSMRTGLVLQRKRGKNDEDLSAKIYYQLTIRSLDNMFDLRQFDEFSTNEDEEALSDFFVQPDDIVIRSSAPFKSVHFRPDWLTPSRDQNQWVKSNGQLGIIIPSNFIILRNAHGYNGNIDPEYLCWFLNSKIGLDAIDKMASHQTISMIRTKALKDIVVPIPELSVQKNLVQLQCKLDREAQIFNQIIANKQKLVDLFVRDMMAM